LRSFLQSLLIALRVHSVSLKIGHRLALSYGAVILLLVLTMATAVFQLKTLSETTGEALNDRYPKTLLVNQLTQELGLIARAMRNALILAEDEQVAEQLRDISAAKIRMTQTLVELKQSVRDPVALDLMDKIRVVHSAYVINQDDFIQLIGSQRMGEARNLLVVDLHGYQNTYFELLEQLRRFQSERMVTASHEVERAYLSSRNWILSIAALALLLSVLVTASITRSLLAKLGGEPEYAAEVARTIAAGNLRVDVEVGHRDVSSLLYAMKLMQGKLIERDEAVQQVNAELVQLIETLRLTHSELVAQEKLAALGALVAGIAHELNTPIGNGLLAASTVVDRTSSFERNGLQTLTRSSLVRYLNEMEAAGDILLRNLSRASELIVSFKQLAVDRQSAQRRRFALTDVVNEVCLTLQPSLKAGAFHLEQQIPPDIRMLSYPGPLGQVLSNLINNAIRHGFEDRDEGLICITAIMKDAGHLELTVRDNGRGIDPAHLHRVFEPFFTTRLGSGGSGLGLHIAFNIVTSILAGKIRVDSLPGQGCTVTLLLPLETIDS